MIVYDSHDFGAFFKIRGSIFPRAILYGLVPACFAYCLKYFELLETNIEGLNQGTIYSGFTFVLGFILVFRTSQSYTRYWMAATAVHTMRAEWCDACGSLIAFAQCSKRPAKEVAAFSHTVIRLFGLMHAMALEEIATMRDENFPLLDIAGLDKRDLHILCCDAAQGRKVEVVCQWIKVYMLRSVQQGVICVDAPILTRVFQELGTGLVHYHEAVQVVIWPFPFPYAQMSAVLIAVYMFVTPFVISLWTSEAWYCGLATLISVVCMKGIDLIAIELENPFGDDPNDLPTWQMHHAMNRDLVLLIHPQTWTIPRLLPTAKMSYNELIAMNETNRLSLEEYYNKQEESTFQKLKDRAMTAAMNSKLSSTSFLDTSDTKVGGMQSWARQNFGNKMTRVARLLNLDREDGMGIRASISETLYGSPPTSPKRGSNGHMNSMFGVQPSSSSASSPSDAHSIAEAARNGTSSLSRLPEEEDEEEDEGWDVQVRDVSQAGSSRSRSPPIRVRRPSSSGYDPPEVPQSTDLRAILSDFSAEMKLHLATHRSQQETFFSETLRLLRAALEKSSNGQAIEAEQQKPEEQAKAEPPGQVGQPDLPVGEPPSVVPARRALVSIEIPGVTGYDIQ